MAESIKESIEEAGYKIDIQKILEILEKERVDRDGE